HRGQRVASAHRGFARGKVCRLARRVRRGSPRAHQGHGRDHGGHPVTWLRVDDMIAFHRKILRAGNEAFGAWVRMAAQSSAEMLDGLVPRETALTIASDQAVIARLVDAKLLEEEGADYRIHDFLEYNPSANETRKLRKARANAGSVGGSKRQANHQASALPVASTPPKQIDTP